MPTGRQIVAATLLALLLLSPAMTFAACDEGSAGSHRCPPGCPMAKLMAKMRLRHHGDQFSAKRDYSCCNVENAAPAPITESQIVAPVLIAVVASTHAPTLPAPLTSRTIASDTSPPLVEPSQARLCTFLS